MISKKFTKLIFIIILPSLLLGDVGSQYEKFKEKVKAQVTKENFFKFGLLFIVYLLFSKSVKSTVKEQNDWWNDFAQEKAEQKRKQEEEKRERAEAERIRREREKEEEEARERARKRADDEWWERYYEDQRRAAEAERKRKEAEEEEARKKKYSWSGSSSSYYGSSSGSSGSSKGWSGDYSGYSSTGSSSSSSYGSGSSYGYGSSSAWSSAADEARRKKERDEAERIKLEGPLLEAQTYEDKVYAAIFSNSDYVSLTNNAGSDRHSCRIFKFFGLTNASTTKELGKKYRTLLQKLHPDKGFSQDITKLINNCKDQCSSLLLS